MRYKLLIAAALFLVGGCKPQLGDGCDTSRECSANLDRICDRSQPGGYCTIANCEPGGCSGEGLCVRFQPDEPRLSSSWCMLKCGSTKDCDRDEYVCRSAAQLNASAGDTGEASTLKRRAEVLDSDIDGKFCVARE